MIRLINNTAKLNEEEALIQFNLSIERLVKQTRIRFPNCGKTDEEIIKYHRDNWLNLFTGMCLSYYGCVTELTYYISNNLKYPDKKRWEEVKNKIEWYCKILDSSTSSTDITEYEKIYQLADKAIDKKEISLEEFMKYVQELIEVWLYNYSYDVLAVTVTKHVETTLKMDSKETRKRWSKIKKNILACRFKDIDEK